MTTPSSLDVEKHNQTFLSLFPERTNFPKDISDISKVCKTFMSPVEYTCNKFLSPIIIRTLLIFATVIFDVNGKEEHNTRFFEVVHIVTFFGENSPKSVKPTNNTIFVL